MEKRGELIDKFGALQPSPNRKITIKGLLVGPPSDLKKVIMMNDNDQNDFLSTIGLDFITHKLNVDGKQVYFQVWDMASQERFSRKPCQFPRSAEAYIFVCDLTDEKSLITVKKNLEDLKEIHPNVVKVLVASKLDNEKELVKSDNLKSFQALGIDMAFITQAVDKNQLISVYLSGKSLEDMTTFFYDSATFQNEFVTTLATETVRCSFRKQFLLQLDLTLEDERFSPNRPNCG